MEVESSMKAAHDKEVETLKNRVKEEQQKTEELKKELRECCEKITSLEEELDSVKESEGPVVTKTLERSLEGHRRYAIIDLRK